MCGLGEGSCRNYLSATYLNLVISYVIFTVLLKFLPRFAGGYCDHFYNHTEAVLNQGLRLRLTHGVTSPFCVQIVISNEYQTPWILQDDAQRETFENSWGMMRD